MIIIAYVLIVLGIILTFFSKITAEVILREKREANEADIVYIKSAGFICTLVAAIMILI